MRPQNDFGEYTISDSDGRTVTYPTYTCGHCSNVVVMHQHRQRPRNLCKGCSRWICESKQICNAACTPIHSLVKDRFENSGSFGTLVNAIMNGAESVDEGLKKGLITPSQALLKGVI